MRASEIYTANSKYLAAADLQGRQIPVIISNVEIAEFTDKNGTKKNKLVLFFEGKEKGMALNVTNSGVMVEAFGDETDNWIGAKIVLFSTKTMYEGKLTDGLRLRMPPQQPAKRQVAGTVNGKPVLDDPRTQARAAPAEDLDDEVPF